jgi:hypothetical protein
MATRPVWAGCLATLAATPQIHTCRRACVCTSAGVYPLGAAEAAGEGVGGAGEGVGGAGEGVGGAGEGADTLIRRPQALPTRSARWCAGCAPIRWDVPPRASTVTVVEKRRATVQGSNCAIQS